MRVFYSVALLFLLMAADCSVGYAADAQIEIVVCNKKWPPPGCRDFPVTTALPPSPQFAAAQGYSLQMKGLNEEQLQKVLSLLGIDKSRIDLAPQ